MEDLSGNLQYLPLEGILIVSHENNVSYVQIQIVAVMNYMINESLRDIHEVAW